MSTLGRWNYSTHEYDPYMPDPSWNIVLFTDNMDEPINCTNCGRDMVFGEGYTSHELHNHVGLGFPVCEACYKDETKRRQEAVRWGQN